MMQQSTLDFSELQCHGITAAYEQSQHASEILAQSLPGRHISIGAALSFICANHYDGKGAMEPGVQELVRAFSDVGLWLVRKVPGLIMGPREARLYVQPRTLLGEYPNLAESIPRPFDYSLVLDSDALPELEFGHEDISAVKDWPDSNEFVAGGRKGEAAAVAFEAALLGKLLPKSGIRVESGLDELCAGLYQEDGDLLKRCDAIHLEFETIGVRFHSIHEAAMRLRRGPRAGFLFVTNSAQLVRVYPDLAELLPYLHFQWPYGHLADSSPA